MMMCELYNPYHFTAIQTSSTFNVAIVTNHRKKLNKSLAEKGASDENDFQT